MGSGTNCSLVGPGLLRRRYSVPEIIMRKHSLAQQKSIEQSIASSAPTPHLSPISHKVHSSNSSTHSSRSEINVSRNGDRDTSMRRQLLRRIWSKEFRQYTESRSGSWSPPMRRSQRRLHIEMPERCKECSKIEQSCTIVSSKRVRLNSSQTSTTACVESISSANSNQSNNDLPIHTSYSGGITETTYNSDVDFEQKIEKSSFDSSISNEVCNNDVDDDDNNNDNNPDILQIEIVDQPTSSMANIDDTERTILTIDESINNSKTDDESSSLSNRNNSSQYTNGNTTAETYEENGNVDGVDQYVSELLVNSLNNLLNSVNEPTYITINDVNKYLKNVDENYNQHVVDEQINYQNNNENRLIYFPRYSMESKDDESIYSNHLSEDDLFDIQNTPNIIPVQTGSTYPNYDHKNGVIVSRFVHRTESMEAEPSSASPRDDHGNGNDSDVSLVDSLDEPIKNERLINENQGIIEKSQSFFIPIVDGDQHIDEHIDVASAMPEKLREKLIKRQQELDIRKKEELNKKQKKIQKMIHRNQIKETEKDKVISSGSTLTSIKSDGKVCNSILANTNGGKHKFLRSEIGMLESYRIDSRGNMQFVSPKKLDSDNGTNKRNPQNGKKSQSRKSGDIITIKRSQTKKSTIDNNHRRKEIIKDVQHMTLYQPDLITPDTECGPRRMYQKTEIHDGEKRIEILEIVECVDSCGSQDGSIPSPSYRTKSTTFMKKSKIPIPVQRSIKCNSRDSCGTTNGKIFIKNIQQLGNNTKVDQMIADLLIEALNHPKEMGIEFVKSPKEFSRSGKRSLISRRNISGSRRSAGGTKYQQIFEVIPEEKGNFSIESSLEESSVKTANSTIETPSLSEIKSTENRMPRGKEAIQSDSLKESEAWVGFFKQQDDSLIDSGNEGTNKWLIIAV